MASGREYNVSIPIRAINYTKEAFNQVSAGMVKLQQQVGSTEKLFQKLDSAGTRMKSTGTEMMIAGGMLAAPIALSVKKVMDFETGLAKIGTMMKGGTKEATAVYGDALRKMSVDTGKSTEDLVASAYELQSSGYTGAEALKLLRYNAANARGGFMETTTSVAGNLAMLKAWGGGAAESLKYMEEMKIANDIGRTNFEKLSNAVGDAASIAANFGVSSASLLSSVAAVTLVTGKTEESMTGFKALMKAVADETKTPVQLAELERLNAGLTGPNKLIFSIKAIQKLGFPEWFRRLNDATKGNATSLNKLFGASREGFDFILNLQKGAESYFAAEKQMQTAGSDGAGVFKREAEAAATLAERMKTMKAKADEMVLTFGEKMVPAIEKMMPGINSMIDKITNFVGAHSGLISFVGEGVIKLIPLLIGVGGLNFALGTILKTVANLRAAFLLLSANPYIMLAIGAIAAGAFVVSEVQKRLEAAQKLEEYNKIPKSQRDAMAEANQLAIVNAGRKAQGLSELKQLEGTTSLDPSVTFSKGMQEANIQAQLTAGLAKAKEDAKKLGKTTGKGFNDGLLDELGGGAGKAKKEIIDIFAGGDQVSVLAGANAGFAADEIRKAAGDKKVNNKNVTIGSVNLPNVFSREDFVSELDKLSLSFGV